MLNGRRLIRIALSASVLLAVLVTSGAAQRPRRMAIGVGLGRTFPLEPLAQAAGQPDYELHNASATSVNVDFWWRSWFGTRFAYQWSRANVEKPAVASFGRIYTLYGAALLAPVQLPLRRPPYLALGAGVRRYNINSQLTSGSTTWDIAPRQNRPAAYGGVGAGFRIASIDLMPEAGVFVNTFRHEYECRDCVNNSTQTDLVLSVRLIFSR